MATRDLQKEQAALSKFGSIYGRMPTSSSDWDNLHNLAYSAADMPDEFKQATPTPTTTAPQPTGTTSGVGSVLPNTQLNPTAPSVSGMPQTPKASGIDLLRQNVDTTRQGAQEYTQPTYALNILQEAIKEKTGAATRQIGESEIFKQAGIGGYGALSSSLAARGKEFQINQTVFQNIVGQMAGIYRDTAKAASDNYNNAVKEYQFEATRLQKIEDDLRNYEQEIKKAERANSLQKELLYYKQSLDTGNTNYNVSNFSGDVGEIASAIGTIESNNNYSSRGADGEIGKYQIMPNNYIAWAKEAGVSPTDYSPQAQDKIANNKINQYWQKYQDPIAVAIAWNGGPGRADAYLKTGVIPNATGTSGAGAAYNVKAYADKFAKVLGLSSSTQTSSGKFTSTETKKLEQADLLDASREEQLNFLFGKEGGTKQYVVADMSAITGGDGFVDTAKYQTIRNGIKANDPELLAWFDKTFPVKEYINPNDPTAQTLIYGN